MKLPKFDRVPLSIPFWTIFTAQYATALASAKELYLTLGGSPSSECLGENSSLTVCETAIGKLLSRITKTREIKKWTSNTSPMDHPYSLVSCNVAKGAELEAILNVDFHIYYVLYLDFLVRLKKKRPKVYSLIRLIVNGMNSYMPCESIKNIVETRFDMYSDELQELFAADDNDSVREINQEKRESRRHLKHLAFSHAVFIQRLKKRYKAVSGLLKPREDKWAKAAIEMFEHALVANNMEYRFDDSEDGDRIDLTACFNLLWKKGSYISESTLYEYDNCDIMGPIVRVVVKSKADLIKFVSLTKMHYLLADLMSTGGRIWR